MVARLGCNPLGDRGGEQLAIHGWKKRDEIPTNILLRLVSNGINHGGFVSKEMWLT